MRSDHVDARSNQAAKILNSFLRVQPSLPRVPPRRASLVVAWAACALVPLVLAPSAYGDAGNPPAPATNSSDTGAGTPTGASVAPADSGAPATPAEPVSATPAAPPTPDPPSPPPATSPATTTPAPTETQAAQPTPAPTSDAKPSDAKPDASSTPAIVTQPASPPAPAPESTERQDETAAPPAPQPTETVAAPVPVQQAPAPVDLPEPADVAADVAPANELSRESNAVLVLLAVCDVGIPGCEDELDIAPAATVAEEDVAIFTTPAPWPSPATRSHAVAPSEPPVWRTPPTQGWQAARAPPAKPAAAPPRPPPRLPIPPVPPSPGPLDLAGALAGSSSQIPAALLAALMTAFLLASPLASRVLPMAAVQLRGPDLVLQLKRPG